MDHAITAINEDASKAHQIMVERHRISSASRDNPEEYHATLIALAIHRATTRLVGRLNSIDSSIDLVARS